MAAPTLSVRSRFSPSTPPSPSRAGRSPKPSPKRRDFARLARPTSPATVLSPSAVERLSSRPGASPLTKSAPQLLGAASGMLPSFPALAPSEARAEETSRARQSFDRRLLMDFDRADDQRPRRLEVSSCGRRAGSPERQDVGLSRVLRRENFKKERYGVQIERSAAGTASATSPGGQGRDSDPLAATVEDFGAVRPEIFEREIDAVQRSFADLEKSLRLEHMTEGGQADRLRAEREAERRRKEEAMRRARKKESEARDPKKKVALRLENKREFEREKAENDARVPTTKVDFGGGFKGHEEVTMVDVLKLRQQCTFLGTGGGVRSMVETIAWRERLERSARLSSMAQTAPPPPSMKGSCSASELYEMKRQRYKELGETRHAQKLLQRIGSMRNTPTYSLPYKFEASSDMAASASQPTLRITKPTGLVVERGGEEKKKDRMVAVALAAKFAADMARSASDAGGSPSRVARKSTLHNLQALMPELMTVSGDSAAAEVAVKRERKAKREKVETTDTTTNEEASKRARKRWLMARALVKWLLIYARLRRNRSAEVVKAMVTQLGEWSRIKKAIKCYMQSIRAIQHIARGFIKTKRQRCAAIEKDWQKVEDQHLQIYFSLPGISGLVGKPSQAADKSAPEATTRKRPKIQIKTPASEVKQQDIFKLVDGSSDKEEEKLDWRSYRIPPPERKKAISRWYMAQLRKHVRFQSSFLETVRTAISAERELVSFLKAFGAAEGSIRDSPEKFLGGAEGEGDDRVYYSASEETILQLVALTAQGLLSLETHWRMHPANMDLPEITQRAVRSRIACARGEVAPIFLGRLAKKAEGTRRPAVTIDEGPRAARDAVPGRLDVDQVFDRYTPRLRKIAEEQSAEHRNVGKAEEAGRKGTLVLGHAHAGELPLAAVS